MRKAENRTLVKTFKALSDESRIEIVRMLSEKSLCVKSLVRRLHISQPAVSQHLRVLREAGLISGEKKGYWVHYSVRSSISDDLKKAIAGILGEPKSRRGAAMRCNGGRRKRE